MLLCISKKKISASSIGIIEVARELVLVIVNFERASLYPLGTKTGIIDLVPGAKDQILHLDAYTPLLLFRKGDADVGQERIACRQRLSRTMTVYVDACLRVYYKQAPTSS